MYEYDTTRNSKPEATILTISYVFSTCVRRSLGYLGHCLSFRVAALRGAELNSGPLVPMTGFREGRSPCLAKPLGKSHGVQPLGVMLGNAT